MSEIFYVPCIFYLLPTGCNRLKISFHFFCYGIAVFGLRFFHRFTLRFVVAGVCMSMPLAPAEKIFSKEHFSVPLNV